MVFSEKSEENIKISDLKEKNKNDFISEFEMEIPDEKIKIIEHFSIVNEFHK